ncbi:MAG: hypothetical protein HYX89_03785 [Chloroflexi bacterium]|nr:hypothetical protein [Chloroflexota bacterium]
MEGKKLSRDELRLLADLAGFQLDEARIDELLPQLELMLRGISRLNRVNLEGVEPAFIEPAKGES